MGSHVSFLIFQVDEWLDFSLALVSGAGLEGACKVMNDFLSLRTFLVDYSVSVADVACWGQLQGTATLLLDHLDNLGMNANLAHTQRVVTSPVLPGCPLHRVHGRFLVETSVSPGHTLAILQPFQAATDTA